MKKRYGKVNPNTTIAAIFETLSAKNKKFINEFVKWKKGSIADKTLLSIKNSLIKFADLLEKDFDKAKKNEITIAWNVVYASKELEVKSKQDDLLHIRQGFKHWFGDDEEIPKVCRGMKRPKSKGRLKLPKKMPTEDDITDIIKKCRNSRDKFFVAWTGLDSAIRPCEARTLKWGDVEKDKEGHYIKVKTAKESGDREDRTIRVIFSEPYLFDWMKDYPSKRKDDEYIFCNLDNPKEPMTASGVISLFRRLKKRINFKGKFSAYTLRHACLTRYSKNPSVSIPLLRVLAGHSKNSTILSEYQHFGDDDVKDMQLAVAGKEKRSKKTYELKNKPIVCPHCNYSNVSDAEVCGECKFALSQQRAVGFEEVEERLKQQMELFVLERMKTPYKISEIPKKFRETLANQPNN